jgi:hypothetical protein
LTIICANAFTCASRVLLAARLPASISTWFAVTTIEAIWASPGACADAGIANAARMMMAAVNDLSWILP